PVLLDGVAPKVALSHPAPQPSAPGQPKPRAPVPMSVLAETPSPAAPGELWQPDPNGDTQHERPAAQDWRASPEAQGPAPAERDQTKVMPTAPKPKALRAPRLRDMAIISTGFLLMVVGMYVSRHESSQNKGPLPALPIKPPPGYIAPKPVAATLPYYTP